MSVCVCVRERVCVYARVCERVCVCEKERRCVCVRVYLNARLIDAEVGTLHGHKLPPFGVALPREHLRYLL